MIPKASIDLEGGSLETFLNTLSRPLQDWAQDAVVLAEDMVDVMGHVFESEFDAPYARIDGIG